MGNENGKLNLHQRLVAVRRSVPYLKKDNKGFQFQYVSSSQTLGNLRSAMDEFNLLLVPAVLEVKTSQKITKKGETHFTFTELFMQFTWINADNPEETLVVPFYGQGVDDAEKGVGKALTYAEKYFLLKFFNIPTDKDDPDSFQKRNAPTKQQQKPQQKKPEQKLYNPNKATAAISDMLAELQYIDPANNESEEGIKISYGVTDLADLTREQAGQVYKRLSGLVDTAQGTEATQTEEISNANAL